VEGFGTPPPPPQPKKNIFNVCKVLATKNTGGRFWATKITFLTVGRFWAKKHFYMCKVVATKQKKTFFTGGT
jgi:hypothetical protein